MQFYFPTSLLLKGIFRITDLVWHVLIVRERRDMYILEERASIREMRRGKETKHDRFNTNLI